MNAEQMLRQKLESLDNIRSKLWDGATIMKRPGLLNKDKMMHHRYFVVDLYEENTETLDCLQMLARIAEWFPVIPLTSKEVIENAIHRHPEEDS